MRQFNITNNRNQNYKFERNRELANLALILFLFTSIFSFANNDIQAKAEKLYANKNYKEAIIAYESILKEGFVSYKLYYNLGNAHYKNNELGKAIYNYELANKLQPNNKDVKTNLRIANEKTIDKIDSKENFFITAVKTNLLSSFTTTTWAWFTIIALIAAALLFFIFVK